MARVAIGVLGVCLVGYLMIEIIHNVYRYTAYRIQSKKNHEQMIILESKLAVMTEELENMNTLGFVDTLIRKRLNYVSKQDVVYQIRRQPSQNQTTQVPQKPKT